MLHPGVTPELALGVLRHEAEERLVGFARSPRPLRARLGRRLMSWGERLAPAERDAPRRTRFAATMVP